MNLSQFKWFDKIDFELGSIDCVFNEESNKMYQDKDLNLIYLNDNNELDCFLVKHKSSKVIINSGFRTRFQNRNYLKLNQKQ